MNMAAKDMGNGRSMESVRLMPNDIANHAN